MATRINTYDPKDIKLIKSRPMFTNFGTGLFDDYVEMHVISGDNTLESSYNISTWSVNQEDTKNQSPTIQLSIHEDIRNLGYRSGRFDVQYNFFRNIVGNNFNSLIIDEISNSRMEIRVRPKDPDDPSLSDEFLAFGRREQNPEIADVEVDFFRDVRLNFGGNEVALATNWLIDYKAYPEPPHSLVIKLYEPLPGDIEEKDELWIVKAIIESITEPILVEYTPPAAQPHFLAPADFSIPIQYDTPTPTGWKTFDELVGTQPTVRDKILNRLSQKTGSLGDVRLNFDFKMEGTDFSKLVHFGSAVEKLENFKYKLQQIEGYDTSISSLSTDLIGLSGTAATGSPHYKLNITKFTNLKRELISTFDEFEQHLYYNKDTHESSSYGEFWPLTWPKNSDTQPFNLESVNSVEAQRWFGSITPGDKYFGTGAIYSASIFDVNNQNSLKNLIPSHIREDEDNRSFELYVDMMSQHFDYIYSYTKELLSIHDRSNPLYEGLSKDLIQPVLESFGWYPHQGFDFNDLWEYTNGTDVSGSYGNENINHTTDFSQSITYANNTQATESFSKEDISKELWKRILNNLPMIYKTKGTERSVRAITNLYGLPSTILKVYEYGGPQKLPNRHSKIIYDKFNYALRIESSSAFGGAYLEAPWAVATADVGPQRYPDTVEFRFKIPDLSHQGVIANSKLKRNTVLWNTHSGSLSIIAEHTTSMNASAPSDSPYGRMVFAISGSQGETSITASTDYGPIFDGDWWSVAFMRYDADKLDKVLHDYAFTESVSIDDHHGQNLTYDLFCKKQGDFSAFGRISHNLTASHTTDGTTKAGFVLNSAWGRDEQISPLYTNPTLYDAYPTAQTASTLKQYLGGDPHTSIWAGNLASEFNSLSEAKTLSGSVQEWRVYHNHLTESYFNYHVSAPRTIANSTNETSSFSDLIARWSLGANLHKVDFVNGAVVSSSHPDNSYTRFRLLNPDSTHAADIQTSASFRGFTNTGLLQYEEVEERYYTLSPRNIGPSPYSEKIRLEDNELKGNLSVESKNEFSSADKNPVDENRLGIYFSPVDEVELDIAHEFGPFEYDDFVGAPSDEYKPSYGSLKDLREKYFRKYTGNPSFFDFLYILKYFDDSLFRTVRQLLPARTNAQVGLLVKPHGLERPKIIARPSASLEGYSFKDGATNNFQQTVIDGSINLFIASASGNTTEVGGVYKEISQSALTDPANDPDGNRNQTYYKGLVPAASYSFDKGRRTGTQALTAAHKNQQINKNFVATTNKEREQALINTAVGELEGGVDYAGYYDHRFEGSRYIYTTVDLSNVSATGENGARIWNPYWERDSIGMTIHTPPHPNIHAGGGGGNLDNYTCSYSSYEGIVISSSAQEGEAVTDAYHKWGLNRKFTTEITIPFVSQSRFSFERKKQLFYYASAYSQSLGRPIPESHILSNRVSDYVGDRLFGTPIPSHSLSEAAQFQDYKATAIHNVYYNGCKLVGSDFNMESSQTIDGGPVVEFNEISPYKYVAKDDGADGRIQTAGQGSGPQRVTNITRGGSSGRVSARPNPRTGRFNRGS